MARAQLQDGRPDVPDEILQAEFRKVELGESAHAADKRVWAMQALQKIQRELNLPESTLEQLNEADEASLAWVIIMDEQMARKSGRQARSREVADCCCFGISCSDRFQSESSFAVMSAVLETHGCWSYPRSLAGKPTLRISLASIPEPANAGVVGRGTAAAAASMRAEACRLRCAERARCGDGHTKG